MNPEDIQRFFSKVKKTDNCWEWLASKDKDGYGHFTVKRFQILAHRFAYELLKEDIPKSLQLDHLCRNRKCVNPDHLEAVTLQENIKRGRTGKLNHHNTKKTHCKRGHEFNEENTYISIKNNKKSRNCRICHNLRCQKYLLKLKIQ